MVMGSSLKFCLIAEGAAKVDPRSGPTMRAGHSRRAVHS